MPTSDPNHLDYLVKRILELNPKTILDIGIGFGKNGFLAREYTDIYRQTGYEKDKWKTKIDGIEIFEKYLTSVHYYIYDNIYVGDAFEILPKLKDYEFIICTAMLEHLQTEKIRIFLDLINKKSNHFFILSPIKIFPQGVVFGNNHEKHIGSYGKKDLELIGKVTEKNNVYFTEK